jgi:ribonuclease-3
MEAIFAAVYLDGGFDKARDLILRVLSDSIETALSGEILFDYKSKVLELAQTKGSVHSVRFEIVDESGPVHDRSYTAAVFMDDKLFGQGVGHSKKLAEQEAAKIAYNEWIIQ